MVSGVNQQEACMVIDHDASLRKEPPFAHTPAYCWTPRERLHWSDARHEALRREMQDSEPFLAQTSEHFTPAA